MTSSTPPLSEIFKWRSLENGPVFRVIEHVIVPIADGDRVYVILETERREIIQVWITPIIRTQKI